MKAFLGMAMLAASVAASEAAAKEPVTLHAVGAQIYRCEPNDKGELAWKFREPVATLLYAGKTVGRHYAGPTWEHADGSLLRGKVAETKPGKTPEDIPVLVLTVTEHRGLGELERASKVLRINTKGGVASGSCAKEGAWLSQPYEADYVFED
jgi:opacity protein-like surface antigen